MSRSTRQCCVSANKNDGFLRVAAASPQIRVADVEGNVEVALAAVRDAAERGVHALVLPELNLTGYTAADLFHNRTLLHVCEAALAHILDETRELPVVFTIGLPVAVAENIYNCAAVCCAGELLGLTAKKYLPNYGEFYERRWFAPAPADPVWIEFAGQGPVPLGSELVYRCCDEGAEDLVLGVEVCEDLWVPAPPSTEMALAGATVILNPSASDEIIGKADYRRSLISNQSARLYCAYAYADASEGESTTDMVFAGENLIYENGSKLAATKLLTCDMAVADVDLDRLVAERRRSTTWTRADDAPEARPLSSLLRACWPKSLSCAMHSASTVSSPAHPLFRPTMVTWPSVARPSSTCRPRASRPVLPIRVPRRLSSVFQAVWTPRWRCL